MLRRAVHLYDCMGRWLKNVDWGIYTLFALAVFELGFLIATMDGCTLEPVSTFSQSGDQL